MATNRAILTETDLLEIVGDREIRTYIETGTLRGEQLEVASRVFPFVIGIEIDEDYFLRTQERVPRARVIHGDTKIVLPELAAEADEPVLWFLDAHYCIVDPPLEPMSLPLWDELIALRQREHSDIVIVDDVHTFGHARDDLRHLDALEWEGVTPESISSVLGSPRGRIVKDCYVVSR